MTVCFHCSDKVPKGVQLTVSINNENQPMCCLGCQAVAQTIVDNNLTDFYKFRTKASNKVELSLPEELKRSEILDDSELQNEFTSTEGDCKETIISLEGLNCSACAWLIEKQLSPQKGVIAINVNATTQRATVKWQDKHTKLSAIISFINKLGYQAQPFQANKIEEANNRHNKAFIKRLGVSGILMMQILMIATGLYFGAFSGMSAHNVDYLRWISLLLTLPIISYCAYPFYLSTITALRVKRLSMDLPVSIAISLAFLASAWATYSQQGEVYFESISMFTFLLLVGKYLEFRARSRAAEVSANLLKLMPLTATIIADGTPKIIPAKKLVAGDLVIVKAGETVPADGVITDGDSHLNEAMLSGEHDPVHKSIGNEVFAGTVNGDGLLTIAVKHNNQQSFLGQLIKLSESAQGHKPKVAQLSDAIAQYFVAILLVVASLTALYWSQQLPEKAFWITLSVLVATCPCALSLATPTALTCSTTQLNRHGIMIKSANALETIAQVGNIAFDKTGTLTSGRFSIKAVDHINENYSKEAILAIAAALEAYSEHPIAKAFSAYKNDSLKCSMVNVVAGSGILASISDTHYCIGKPKWLLAEQDLPAYKNYQCILVAQQTEPQTKLQTKHQTQQCQSDLYRVEDIIAAFSLADFIRDDAATVISTLKQQGYHTAMLSGDHQQGCQTVQDILQLDEVHSGLTATEKLEILSAQQQKHTTAMVGDGVNDAPVFSAAHVSIAMGCGTDIAKSGADIVLLNDKLTSILTLNKIASQTKAIIRQNYAWAFGYNAIILPLSVSGYVTPYIAVIGMSVSSLIVVSNSLRLLKS